MASTLPEVEGPYPVKLLNTGSDDAYLCFDFNMDTAYFTSDRDGNFDIYLQKRPAEIEISIHGLTLIMQLLTKADSINSTSDDKCPMVYQKYYGIYFKQTWRIWRI